MTLRRSSIKPFNVLVMATVMHAAAAYAEQSLTDKVPLALTSGQIANAIRTVQTQWRSGTGDTIAFEFQKASEVAHFIPRDWTAEQKDDGTVAVSVNIAKYPTDTDGDTWQISWCLDKSGKLILNSGSERTMDLGWQAFQISMVQNDFDQKETSADKAFLMNLRNLNFVITRQGRLGDLLENGHCRAESPIIAEYTDTWVRDNPSMEISGAFKLASTAKLLVRPISRMTASFCSQSLAKAQCGLIASLQTGFLITSQAIGLLDIRIITRPYP